MIGKKLTAEQIRFRRLARKYGKLAVIVSNQSSRYAPPVQPLSIKSATGHAITAAHNAFLAHPDLRDMPDDLWPYPGIPKPQTCGSRRGHAPVH